MRSLRSGGRAVGGPEGTRRTGRQVRVRLPSGNGAILPRSKGLVPEIGPVPAEPNRAALATLRVASFVFSFCGWLSQDCPLGSRLSGLSWAIHHRPFGAFCADGYGKVGECGRIRELRREAKATRSLRSGGRVAGCPEVTRRTARRVAAQVVQSRVLTALFRQCERAVDRKLPGHHRRTGIRLAAAE